MICEAHTPILIDGQQLQEVEGQKYSEYCVIENCSMRCANKAEIRHINWEVTDVYFHRYGNGKALLS